MSMATVSQWQAEYREWCGMAWECPICDAQTEPHEDSGICIECVYSD